MNLIWFQYLNGLAGKKIWFDGLIVFFGEYLGWVIFACLGVYLLFRQEKVVLKMVIFSLTSGVAALVITAIVRLFYFHPRPFALLADLSAEAVAKVEALAKAGFNINQLIIHSPTASLPSAHAAFFFALATGVWIFKGKFRKLGFLLFLAAFLISLARVIAGIHWPYDIIAGAIVGIASAFLLRYLWHRYHSLVFKQDK